MRSGPVGRSARLVHTCGVMQFGWRARRSVAASFADHLGDLAALAARHLTVAHPLRRALRDRLLDDDVRSIPVFQRHRFSGRSRVCGTIAGATAS